jgi:hypothetical protein
MSWCDMLAPHTSSHFLVCPGLLSRCGEALHTSGALCRAPAQRLNTCCAVKCWLLTLPHIPSHFLTPPHSSPHFPHCPGLLSRCGKALHACGARQRPRACLPAQKRSQAESAVQAAGGISRGARAPRSVTEPYHTRVSRRFCWQGRQ